MLACRMALIGLLITVAAAARVGQRNFEVNQWPLVGHGQNWWDCSTGYEIISCALRDHSHSPSR